MINMEYIYKFLNNTTPLPKENVPGTNRRRHRILMVSDFFYPNVGGVENHIYQLSQCLICQGHKVVVLTHAYGNCSGVRYLTNGLKVYYAPRLPIYQQSTLPTLCGNLRLLRNIVWRERVTVVHAHQAFSTMGLEACTHAHVLGLADLGVVFTDHSLFGFADPSSILANKLLKAALGGGADAVICVSHTSKENTTLRAGVAPRRVYTIPNAMDAEDFRPPGAPSGPDPFGTTTPRRRANDRHVDDDAYAHPNHSDDDRNNYVYSNSHSNSNSNSNGSDFRKEASGNRNQPAEPSGHYHHQGPDDPDDDGLHPHLLGENEVVFSPRASPHCPARGSHSAATAPVTLVALSRLVYRKGVGLLAMALPEICRRHPDVRVVIGGDGPMKKVLQKVIEDARLGAQVSLLGHAVPHEEVRDFLLQGQVFLSPSLTEAFGIALVEAAAAGLVVVATAVGGVPEVLPRDMLLLAEPSPEGVVEAVDKAMARVRLQDPVRQHARVRQMYNWNDIAYRTVTVYDAVAAEREGSGGRPKRDVRLVARCRRYMACGFWIGLLFCVAASLCELYCRIVLDLVLQPLRDIDVAPDWPLEETGFRINTAAEAAAAARKESALGLRRKAGETGTKNEKEEVREEDEKVAVEKPGEGEREGEEVLRLRLRHTRSAMP